MATPELEALVGHLFVFGGRSISTAAPGAIAMPSPRRPARGRDSETFFGLVALSEGQRQPATFYEELVSKLYSEYFKTPGSVTAALRQAMMAVNKVVLEQNKSAPAPIEAGLACAILREQEVLLAVTGPARCFLIRDGFSERLPTDEELKDGSPPLGDAADVDVRYYRREIRAGDYLVLSDSTLNRLTDDTLRQAAATGEVNVTLNNLAAVSADYTTAEVIKFISPLEEAAALTEVTAEGLPALAEEAEPEPKEPPEPRITAKKAGYNTARGLARFVGGIRTLTERMLPEDDVENPLEEHWEISPALQFGIALSVAVLVALITTGVYRLRGQTSQYAQLVREAQTAVEAARTVAGDQAQARPEWEKVIFLLDQAAGIRPPSAEVQNLRQEAFAALDSYDGVTRINPVLMREYQPGSYLRGPIIQGVNLYVIDETNDILYREDLDENGVALINAEPQIITRQGEVVSGQVIGGLIDLTWMEDGGVPQRNVLTILARNGLLITYSPSWDVTASILPGFEAWQDPRAIAVYNRDLYILDAGANEIWRYVAGADAYPNTPQRYFTDIDPGLGDAVDMQIDSNGNFFILHSSGRVSKFFFGRPEVFEFEDLPQPLSRPTSLFLNLSLFDRSLYIADAGGGRLYNTALTGTFLFNFKDDQDVVFDAISGIYDGDQTPYVYVTSGNALYYFTRP